MSLIRKDPLETLLPLREAMNRLFEESFIGPGRFDFFTTRPFPVDIYETEDKLFYVIEASLPGFKLEDLQITAQDNMLTIRVVKKFEKTEKPTYLRREHFEGEMIRTFDLPTTIDVEKVQATYEHGLLTIRVPKLEVVKEKLIPIRIKEVAGVR